MQNLIEQYNISKSFYKRYFEENAKARYGMELLKFLYFKDGKFHNPLKKDIEIEQYIQEEIDNFFNKREINIPQIEFCVTTKCTLKCKDCCALIPKFKNHIDMSFKEFKLWLDILLNSVRSIRHLVMLGGETLINPHLSEMIDYACSCDKIFIVQLITNGTMSFSSDLLDVLKKHNKKVYVYISNYSANSELESILKYDEIKTSLNKKDIKLQMAQDKFWVSELGFQKTESNREETMQKIQDCFRTQCNQVINGHLDICSKAYAGRILNLIDTYDSVKLENNNNLKDDLIHFYSKDYSDACKYCILSNEKVLPALQDRTLIKL